MSAPLALPAFAQLRREIDHMRLLLQERAESVVQLQRKRWRHVSVSDVIATTASHENARAVPFHAYPVDTHRY